MRRTAAGLLREGRVVGVGEGSCNAWEAKYRYRWVAEEQVPEHLDRTHLPKRGARRTLCEFDFAIERAETSGPYGKPAEHWQRFREAIRSGTAQSVEKLTRRGKSVAWEIDVDAALYRIPNPDVADVVNTVQKMAQKRSRSCHPDCHERLRVLHPGRGGYRSLRAEPRHRVASARDTRSPGVRSRPQAGGAAVETGRPSGARYDWEAVEELRRDAPCVRATTGAGGGDTLSRGTGTGWRPEPCAVPVGGKALACYWRLARIAAQPEVA